MIAVETPLDLHEGIRTPPSEGCGRWPKDLRLLNGSTGQLALGRCKATNLCRYCQKLYVVETVEMLTLDAMEYAPTVWMVLTAREHLTRKDCTEHLRKLRKAARKRWPNVEWMVQVEFQRRGALHLNLLVKGLAPDDADEFGELLSERWCARVDAEPVGQWCEAIEDGVGAVRYISKMLAHGLKAEQAPPIGWKGHRTSQTRGYLVRPASVMRREARESLALKRSTWKALQEGHEPIEAHAIAEVDALRRSGHEWEIVKLSAKPTGEVLLRTLQNGEPRTFMRRRANPLAAWFPEWLAKAKRDGLFGPVVDVGVLPVDVLPRSSQGDRDALPRLTLFAGALDRLDLARSSP